MKPGPEHSKSSRSALASWRPALLALIAAAAFSLAFLDWRAEHGSGGAALGRTGAAAPDGAGDSATALDTAPDHAARAQLDAPSSDVRGAAADIPAPSAEPRPDGVDPEAAVITLRIERARGGVATVFACPLVAGVPAGEPLARVAVPAGRTIHWTVAHVGEVAVVALARGARPVTRLVTLGRASRVDLGPLLVDDVGAAIEGEVRSGEAPAARCVVACFAPPGAPRVTLPTPGGPTTLAFVRGELVLAGDTATSGDDGMFTLSGLEPGPHTLIVSPPTEAHSVDLGRPLEVEVTAPARGVALQVGFGWLELTLELPADLDGVGALRYGTYGRLQSESALASRALRADPLVRVALEPGAPTGLSVEFAGYEPAALEVTAAHAGEVLQRTAVVRRATGTVRLTLVLRGAVPERPTTFLLLDAAPSDPADPGASLQPDAPPPRAVSAGDRVTFEGVTGGPRALRLVASAGFATRPRGLADTLVNLDLPWQGEHEAEVTLARGARVRARALGADGAPVDARARILTRAGAVVPVLFTVPLTDTLADTSTWSLAAVPAGEGWNELVPRLAPGDYVLEVHYDGATRRDVAFTVTSTDPVDVTAQR